MKNMWLVSVMVSGLVIGVGSARAEETRASEKAEASEAAKNAPALAAGLKGAKVTLSTALAASEKEGKPISAKFEVEDGKLQLSVYTMKGEQLFEVIVDHSTGKVAKVEPITGGDDLAAAKSQAGALAKAKSSLGDAVARAEKANGGYRAVSVMPELEGGIATAEVGLLKGNVSKQVDERL